MISSRDFAEPKEEEEHKCVEQQEPKKCSQNPQNFTDEDDNEEEEEEDKSPRGVLEIAVTGADSDHSNSSRSCSSSSQEKSIDDGGADLREAAAAEDAPPSRLQWRGLIDAFKRKSSRRFSTIPSSRGSFRRRLSRIRHGCVEGAIDCDQLLSAKPTWRCFDMPELAAATDNFSPENLIGRGGHAEVYRGCLADGQLVAVKKLKRKENDGEERTGDFLSELGIIAHIHHPNAARLVGFGTDGGLHLVLQLAPHGSLASVLHGSEESLPWNVRFKVALGVAEGLKYLHHDCQRRIIHRDIKASNILLAEDYRPQISDFGLAKWLPENWAHHIIFPIEGTFGYLSPEYFMHGIANEKSDVFAFGVLLLELITGRRAVDSCRQSLVMWAKPLLDKNNVKDLIDPQLGDSYEPTEMRRAMLTASMCINHLSMKRPHMNRVVKLLRGEGGLAELKQKSMGGRAMLIETDLEDYTCTTYLSDLNRHRQLVLE